MQPLNPKLHRCLLIERATVAATLDECDARYHRIAEQRLNIEDHRTADQPMDEQPMCCRFDVRHAIVRSFEMQAVGGD